MRCKGFRCTYLGEKSIVCTTFNVCLICRASIKLRVCLSFMSWRKQSGFYLREKHFKDLSICYQVKLNRQLNAVYSSCSNIFPLHMAVSLPTSAKETDLLIYAQSVLSIPFGWLGFVEVHLSGSREHLRGTEVVVILCARALLSGPHELIEHCGCSGERELHLYF